MGHHHHHVQSPWLIFWRNRRDITLKYESKNLQDVENFKGVLKQPGTITIGEVKPKIEHNV